MSGNDEEGAAVGGEAARLPSHHGEITPNGNIDGTQLNFHANGIPGNSRNERPSHEIIQITDIGDRNKTLDKMEGKGDKADTKEDEGEDSEQKQVMQRTTKFLEYNADQHEIEVEMGFVDPSNPPVPGFNLYYMQWRTRRFVEHFAIRLLTFTLILVDMIILFVDLLNPHIKNDPLEYCSLAFSTYFMIEVILRIFGLGPQVFFRAWHNVLDCFLVVFTFILSVVTVCLENMSSNPVSLIVALRLVRLVRITRILWERRHLQRGARQFVSQNKRRYQQNGYDLDLTYVMPRVIAMSFPSTGRMSMYRNDIKEVARFMDTQHPGHYRLYNLCSERHYDETLFHGRVERFYIDDHNVPPLT
ncbi:Phosphatidylinositol 3,4,5-trisphosphate 3-phosphatase tpte2 [Halocaridina rubra]|uniref:Phosphatidylinositol 3,4,5-trisphosphate 3-phosphatase tpte2 n=1 Tax=Halocaridina rubra TaxID=373956 RepID=A0AAN8WPW0_HALRR